MTRYVVEANTGSSMWPVTEYETSAEVDAYLRSQTTYALQVSPGNPGMYVAPRAADVLVSLLDAKVTGAIQPGKEDVHEQAIHETAKLVQLAALHSGASIQWQQPGS